MRHCCSLCCYSTVRAVCDMGPCAAVVDGMLQNENFLSRPVAARFPGFAQINYDPGA